MADTGVTAHGAHRVVAGRCEVCGPATSLSGDGRCAEGQRIRHRAYVRGLPQAERTRRSRHYGLLHKYGITLERYEVMLAAQGGVCAVCGSPPQRRGLDVDHDHRCCAGRRSCGDCIRGLLCSPCNRAVGYLRDDPSLLRAAAVYLEGVR